MPQLYRLARRFITVRREQELRRLWSPLIPVQHRSCAENVYHCCLWRTGSQWFRNLFSATSVYRFSGLLAYTYGQFEGRDTRPLPERSFDSPFPLRRIITPIYINFENFQRIPKPAEYRAFYVVRDPRDLVVSHYFSSKYSHVANPTVLQERAQLEGLSDSEGIIANMKYMAERGVFDALRSWTCRNGDDERIRVFRFEDLVGDNQRSWIRQLMSHCDIQIPDKNLDGVLNRLSFAKLSGGRKKGEESKFHKYRSGKHGNWREHFDEQVASSFYSIAGDLPSALGYDP